MTGAARLITENPARTGLPRAFPITEHRYGGATMKPATPERVYLQQVHPSVRCFLDEVLYWLTFQRLPLSFVDCNGDEVHSVVMPGYRTDFDFADHRLAD